jgi:hypothetical protein
MPTETEPGTGIDPSAVLTEPMRVRELARYFAVEAHKMRRMLDHIAGAQKLDGMWRVPILSMPPLYLLSRGLIKPAVLPADGIKWNRFENSSFARSDRV